jgi:aspartate kinase
VTILRIVQKYGGSSIATTEKILNVAHRIVKSYNEGNDIIVVVSAQGDTTDELIKHAYEINNNPSKRELDALLSTGEQKSASLMAMAFQIEILSTNTHNNAEIKKINTQRIDNELSKGNIVIVTGFQAIDEYNDITTLGRGGSDTTAVAIAVETNANFCEIYTDVDGVYSSDPNIDEKAVKYDEISYSDMLTLCNNGAKVLHYKSVEIAKKYELKLVVRSSFNNSEGTVVK